MEVMTKAIPPRPLTSSRIDGDSFLVTTSYALLDDKPVAVQRRRADLRSVMTPSAVHTAEITAR